MSLRARARLLALATVGGCLAAATIAAPASADVNTYVCQVSCQVTVYTSMLAAAPEAPGSPTSGATATNDSGGSNATAFGNVSPGLDQLSIGSTSGSASNGPTGTSVQQGGTVIDQFPDRAGEGAGASSNDGGTSAGAGAYRYSVLGSATSGASATSSATTSTSQAGGCVITIAGAEQACIVNTSTADSSGATNQTTLVFNNQEVVITVTTNPDQPVIISSNVPLLP